MQDSTFQYNIYSYQLPTCNRSDKKQQTYGYQSFSLSSSAGVHYQEFANVKVNHMTSHVTLCWSTYFLGDISAISQRFLGDISAISRREIIVV